MGTKPVAPLLLGMAFPIMISMLVQALYNIVDSIFVARLSDAALAAVSFAYPVQMLTIAVAVGTSVGVNALLSRRLGEGNREAADKVAHNGMLLMFFSWLAFAVFGLFCSELFFSFFTTNPAIAADGAAYLRVCLVFSLGMFFQICLERLIQVTGRTVFQMLSQMSGAIVNIILDPILIFGLLGAPKLGVLGAAVATVTAQGIVFALLARYAVQDQTLFAHVHLKRPAVRSELAAISKVSGPATAMNIIFPLIGMVIARLVAGWGDAAVAVQKVGSQIESISWMTADGFAAAVNSFIAQNCGAGNLRRARRGFGAAFLLMTIWGILCTALLVFCAAPIFRFFIPEADVLPMGVDYLVILGYSELFMCWEILVGGAYAGFGNTMPSSVVSIVFTGLRIPAAIALSATALGLSGVWWSISISSIFKGVILTGIFLVFLARLTRKQQICVQ